MTLVDKYGAKLDMSKFYDSDVAGNRKRDIESGKRKHKSLFYEDNAGTLLKVFTTNEVGKKIIGDDVFSPKAFETIKEIKNPSIVKLYDYYSDSDLRHDIDAYTMEKVHTRKIDILTEDKAILLCYLSDLQKLAKDLSDKGIRMNDPNGANLLFNDRGPVVVDLDYYYKHMVYSKNELETWNKSIALNYFHNYAINNYINDYSNHDEDELVRYLNDLNGIFAMRMNNKTDIVKCVEDNLIENSIAHQLKLKRTK